MMTPVALCCYVSIEHETRKVYFFILFLSMEGFEGLIKND